MNWAQVLELLTRACEEQGEERRVLLVLADVAYHVREVAGGVPSEGDLLAFIVYRDDPELSNRTEETSLLIVRPEQVLRVEVRGYDGASDHEGGLGFGG